MNEELQFYMFQALHPVLKWFSSVSMLEFEGVGVLNIVAVLTAACMAVVGVVFLWWGVRKVVQMIMSAFRSGRISL